MWRRGRASCSSSSSISAADAAGTDAAEAGLRAADAEGCEDDDDDDAVSGRGVVKKPRIPRPLEGLSAVVCVGWVAETADAAADVLDAPAAAAAFWCTVVVAVAAATFTTLSTLVMLFTCEFPMDLSALASEVSTFIVAEGGNSAAGVASISRVPWANDTTDEMSETG